MKYYLDLQGASTPAATFREKYLVLSQISRTQEVSGIVITWSLPVSVVTEFKVGRPAISEHYPEALVNRCVGVGVCGVVFVCVL